MGGVREPFEILTLHGFRSGRRRTRVLPGMVVATMPNAKQQRHRRHIETAIATYLKSLTP
jgi:hypothetical protein